MDTFFDTLQANSCLFYYVGSVLNQILTNNREYLITTSQSIIVIPFHITNHWILYIINDLNKECYYFDSMDSKNKCDESYCINIGNILINGVDIKSFKLKKVKYTLQTDSYSCGLFVMIVT